MAEVINPAIVPKVTLPSGEQVPCVGMGTFGSDREIGRASCRERV